MFVERREAVREGDVVLQRQRTVWSVVRGDTPDPASPLQAKAAAVCGHRAIDPLVCAKVYKSLDRILRASSTEAKSRLLDGVALGVGDWVRLPVRPPIVPYLPDPPSAYDFKLPVRRSYRVSLYDFERMAFEHRGVYQFYEGVSFAAYFYQNAVYAFPGDDDRWQSRLLRVIRQTNFCAAVCTAAFYEDTVVYRGDAYDTSFVPNYDVNALAPLARIGCEPRCRGCTTETRALAYRAALDVRRVRRVPPEYARLFAAFPFKDGHHIRPDGTVRFLDVDRSRRATRTANVLQNCDPSDDGDLADAARTLRLEDVFYYALHVDRLESQGTAMLVLRRMIGNTFAVDGVRITLPFRGEVLEWCSSAPFRHEPSLLLLPEGVVDGGRHRDTAEAIALVRDIAVAARSKLAAAYTCSRYHLMECHYRAVYEATRTDAQRYVVLTLVMQQYDLNAYRRYRDRALRPVFPDDDDASGGGGGHRAYTRPLDPSATIQDRLDASTQRLITPVEVSAVVRPVLDPIGNMETCEFADPQLAALVEHGDVELTRSQTAAYVTLFLSTDRAF